VLLKLIQKETHTHKQKQQLLDNKRWCRRIWRAQWPWWRGWTLVLQT